MKNIFLFSALAVLLLGSCVSDPKPPAPTPPPAQPQRPPAPSGQYTRHSSGIILNGAAQYTVKAGDTLAHIARQFYDDGSYYPVIMMVCDDVVSDPDKISPQTHLTVPVLKVNLDDATARASINNYLLKIAVIEEQRNRNGTAALMRNHAR